jgi:hypothetical protein
VPWSLMDLNGLFIGRKNIFGRHCMMCEFRVGKWNTS